MNCIQPSFTQPPTLCPSWVCLQEERTNNKKEQQYQIHFWNCYDSGCFYCPIHKLSLGPCYPVDGWENRGIYWLTTGACIAYFKYLGNSCWKLLGCLTFCAVLCCWWFLLESSFPVRDGQHRAWPDRQAFSCRNKSRASDDGNKECAIKFTIMTRMSTE